MRYSKTHKEETRKKLLDSARATAKRGGFEVTGVDALMGGIGLTGGAFYTHFASKDELLAEVIAAEMENSAAMLAGDANSHHDHVTTCLRNYLSTFHVMNPEVGCVLPALGAEIARADSSVKQAVEKGLKATQKSWKDRVGDSDAAWALIAQCVGALVLARAVESEKTCKEILAASRRFLDKSVDLTPQTPAN